MEGGMNGPAVNMANVNFIVGDDSSVDDPACLDIRLDDEESNDIFPSSPGMTSNSSYNNMFGLTERRRRLRYLISD
ncbi:hypothetical protein O3M35_007668 [Rhynocoris fuscipes]|uniref:Uncharacterized protein n=1 Tax=Rhynocoris fuscipes TaxID=488301 RepID=A0AAW1DA63_9HEMI